MRRRAAFVRAARGLRIVKPAFVLQVYQRAEGDYMGVGFTASRRVGNAVARNRARRRLKEVARLHLAANGLAGCDHVLVARQEAQWRPFDELETDFTQACAQARRRLNSSDAGSPGH